MPKLTLEDGTVVAISQESYDALKTAVQKDWRNAVEEFKDNFAKRTGAEKPLYNNAKGFVLQAGMEMYQSQIRSLRDKAIILYCLSNGGLVTVERGTGKIFFRPGPEGVGYERAKDGIRTLYKILFDAATEEEIERNNLKRSRNNFNRASAEIFGL